MTKHSETFTRDNNMGLVKQCLSSLYKKNIQRLTKVRPWPGPSDPGLLFSPRPPQRRGSSTGSRPEEELSQLTP